MSEKEINYWLEVFSKDNQAFMSKDGLIMPLFKVFEQLKEFQHENRQLKQELKLVESLSCFNMPDNIPMVCMFKADYERNKYEYETIDKYKSVLDEIREVINQNMSSYSSCIKAFDEIEEILDKVEE